MADQILEQTNAERQHFAQQYQALEQLSAEQMTNTGNCHHVWKHSLDDNCLVSAPLSAATVAQAEEMQQLQHQLAALATQHDDDLRALQQTQLAALRQHLRSYLPMETNDQIEVQSIEDIVQHIIDQTTRERDQFRTGNATPI
jgi:hypothetical protein